jgi:hypothetical protein
LPKKFRDEYDRQYWVRHKRKFARQSAQKFRDEYMRQNCLRNNRYFAPESEEDILAIAFTEGALSKKLNKMYPYRTGGGTTTFSVKLDMGEATPWWLYNVNQPNDLHVDLYMSPSMRFIVLDRTLFVYKNGTEPRKGFPFNQRLTLSGQRYFFRDELQMVRDTTDSTLPILIEIITDEDARTALENRLKG